MVYGSRYTAEMTYEDDPVGVTCDDPLVGRVAHQNLAFNKATAREPYYLQERLTDLFDGGGLEKAAGLKFVTACDLAIFVAC